MNLVLISMLMVVSVAKMLALSESEVMQKMAMPRRVPVKAARYGKK